MKSGPRLAEIGGRADGAGFASLWVMDRFFQIQFAGPAKDPLPSSTCRTSPS